MIHSRVHSPATSCSNIQNPTFKISNGSVTDLFLVNVLPFLLEGVWSMSGVEVALERSERIEVREERREISGRWGRNFDSKLNR